MNAIEPRLRNELRPGDREAVAALVAASGFFNAEELAIALELVDERMLRGDASGYHVMCAEHAERLLGYACWGPIAGTHNSFDLYWIVVDTALQRRGIGRLLLNAIEAQVGVQGGGLIWVETSGRAQYQPTRFFYQCCGYIETARLPDFYGPDDAKVICVKRVPG